LYSICVIADYWDNMMLFFMYSVHLRFVIYLLIYSYRRLDKVMNQQNNREWAKDRQQ